MGGSSLRRFGSSAPCRIADRTYGREGSDGRRACPGRYRAVRFFCSSLPCAGNAGVFHYRSVSGNWQSLQLVVFPHSPGGWRGIPRVRDAPGGWWASHCKEGKWGKAVTRPSHSTGGGPLGSIGKSPTPPAPRRFRACGRPQRGGGPRALPAGRKPGR